MPKRKLTEGELKTNEVDRKVKKFMHSVRTFLASKSGGVVPPEWECSIMLLEEYYRLFVTLSLEIEGLPSLIVPGRYSDVPHPLLTARDRASVRLESAMKALGLTLKSALTMEIAEPVQAESPLEAFVKDKIEKR